MTTSDLFGVKCSDVKIREKYYYINQDDLNNNRNRCRFLAGSYWGVLDIAQEEIIISPYFEHIELQKNGNFMYFYMGLPFVEVKVDAEHKKNSIFSHEYYVENQGMLVAYEDIEQKRYYYRLLFNKLFGVRDICECVFDYIYPIGRNAYIYIKAGKRYCLYEGLKYKKLFIPLSGGRIGDHIPNDDDYHSLTSAVLDPTCSYVGLKQYKYFRKFGTLIWNYQETEYIPSIFSSITVVDEHKDLVHIVQEKHSIVPWSVAAKLIREKTLVQYDEIIKCSDGYDIRIVESWGRLDQDLNVVIEPQFEERLLDDCVTQFVQVVETRKWGLYNVIDHSFVILPIYDEMHDLGSESRTHIRGNLIVVKKSNQQGCISEVGREIVPCRYEGIHICDVSPQYVMAGYTHRDFIPVFDVYNVNGEVIIKSCRSFKKCEIEGYTDCNILTAPILVDDNVILNHNNESIIPDENGNIVKFSYPINLPYDLDGYAGLTMQKVSSNNNGILVCQAKYPFIFNRASRQVIRGLGDEKFMDMFYYSDDYIVVGMDDGRSEFSDRIYSYIYTDHRGRFGAINSEGEVIIPPIYAVLTRPSCGFIFAAKITKQAKKTNGDMKVETLDIYLIEIKSRKSIICYKDVPEAIVETMLETGCLFVTTKERGLNINDTYSWNEIIIPRYSRYTTHEMSYISSYAFKPRSRINEKYWDGQGFYKPEMEDRLD